MKIITDIKNKNKIKFSKNNFILLNLKNYSNLYDFKKNFPHNSQLN